MTRKQFEIAYREARCILRTFLGKPDRNGRIPTHSEKVGAEEKWIAGCKGPNQIAFLTLGARGPTRWLSNGATYANKHGFYHTDRTSWRGWVRAKLATRKAV